MSWFLPERKALFLHVPRTGGTWIKQSLYLAGISMEKWGNVCELYRPRKHTILPHYHPELLDRVKNIISFVRHPVPYYISVWRFTKRAVVGRPERMQWRVFDGNDPSAINESVNRWKPDFDEWLEEMLEEEPGWVTRWFERYVGPVRGEFCHFIGRTETIEEDMKQVVQILGYEKEWEKSKESRSNIMYAKNCVRTYKAEHVKMNSTLEGRVERSERVAIRRFYGEETFKKRVYRNLTGEPV